MVRPVVFMWKYHFPKNAHPSSLLASAWVWDSSSIEWLLEQKRDHFMLQTSNLVTIKWNIFSLLSSDFVLTVASQKMQIEKSKVGWLQIPTMILLHLLLVWPLNVLNNSSKQLILCTGSAPVDTLLLQIAIISDDGAWTLHYQNRLSAETPHL
jgi:hypothetical protein